MSASDLNPPIFYENKPVTLQSWTQHAQLIDWIQAAIRLCRPARVHLVSGSEAENDQLIKQMVHAGVLIPCNQSLRPGSYVARSTTSDVARVEERTYICSQAAIDAGYTNNWSEPSEMENKLNTLFDSCMRGRTLFVTPFCMGPLNSPFSIVGVEITDSPYVVANMRIMTRMGDAALAMLGNDKPFVPCMHSVGAPLNKGQEDTTWPQNPDNKYIVHYPEERRIWSFGSGYGGNALLGKKCLALRIASVVARDEGWLAEHMLIVGITNPQGVKKYIAAAFPSACGKTNMAMLTPSLPGWKVETVGDDIAWMRIGKDGRLYAVNPEAGFFGVAPGTSMKSNPNAMLTMEKNTLFTNVALTDDGDVWWEGKTTKTPERLTSWLRTERYADSNFDAAHPNSRFTVPASQCPTIDPAWVSPEGVPISAIIFGGRRPSTVPLVYEARSWEHGVFLGASMTSETTAAAAGKRGVLRNDPFAMRPFCGYNMGDYFAHWASMAQRTSSPDNLPKVFHVNWFRKSKQGSFLWPGFGDNIRVIDWILKRCENPSDMSLAAESPIGYLPKAGAVDVDGLSVDAAAWHELTAVEPSEWISDCKKNREFFANFGERLPAFITKELDTLQSNLEQAQNKA